MKIIKLNLENIENEKNFNQRLIEKKHQYDNEISKYSKDYEARVG